MQVAAQAVLLRQELLAVFEEMPRDLQQTMLSSPQRAALLQVPGPQNKVRMHACRIKTCQHNASFALLCICRVVSKPNSD